MRARRRRRRSEKGFTLIEIGITSALMLIVLAMVLPQLTSSITMFDNAQVRSTTTDQAQIATGRIEHDVLASNVMYLDNTLPNGTGIVHLQAYGTAGAATCVEYAAINGALVRRTKASNAAVVWPPTSGPTATWSNVITGIVNSTQAGTPAVFAVPAANQYRSLVVTLWLNTDTRPNNPAAPAKYTTTITGRALPANASSTTGPC